MRWVKHGKMRLESAFSVPVQLKCVGLGIVLTVAKKIHLVGWLAVARKKYAFGQVACCRSQKKSISSGGLLWIAKKMRFIRWPAVDRKKNAFEPADCKKKRLRSFRVVSGN